ncbi:hypothetical protein [Polaribacter butkevichii]|uniref:Uncharacterized protein n=1 Tax=Polaribacter butkevichii TaxID=218490 RepID=A0A2P6CEF1_9FLAO|nr:hypothetical protein [Polaribacter butkevichii]PQJ73285.1 hypothetical protein BTO14_08430 [Polaribacter butkevichii]
MKTMKTNYLKLGVLGLMMMVGTAINAQTTDPTAATVLKDTPADGAVVRVIDNKGTIKYFQSNNGITTITSTTPGNLTTTTWQLGGTLTDNTYIDVDGKAFALDGIALIDPATEAASTDATTLSSHGTGTGWTLLVRDEATGETKKMLATDLITSGQTYFTATDGQLAYDVTSAGSNTAMTGSQIPLPEFSKVWVYRNGAKLIAGLDYTIAAASSTVTLVPNTTAPNDWTVYAGDVIEVQYFK